MKTLENLRSPRASWTMSSAESRREEEVPGRRQAAKYISAILRALCVSALNRVARGVGTKGKPPLRAAFVRNTKSAC